MNKPISDLRQDYTKSELTESNIQPNPINQFVDWFEAARHSGVLEPNAMTLSTIDENGHPKSRIVLLKEVENETFVFYTNYESAKGNHIKNHPVVALTFWWDKMERQVNISGSIEKVTREQAEKYFHSRPVGSQIGAWVSHQSSIVPNREFLENKLTDLTKQFEGKTVPLPDYWGGYRVIPATIEFWQGRTNRLHDRIRYTKIKNDEWKIERLSP